MYVIFFSTSASTREPMIVFVFIPTRDGVKYLSTKIMAKTAEKTVITTAFANDSVVAKAIDILKREVARKFSSAGIYEGVSYSGTLISSEDRMIGDSKVTVFQLDNGGEMYASYFHRRFSETVEGKTQEDCTKYIYKGKEFSLNTLPVKVYEEFVKSLFNPATEWAITCIKVNAHKSKTQGGEEFSVKVPTWELSGNFDFLPL